MLRNYFTITFRNLSRHRSYAVINVLGLALGITCAVVIFAAVRYETGFDRFHRLADRTYRIVQHTKFAEGEEHWGETAYPLAAALRADFPALERVTQAAGPFSRIISAENGKKELIRFQEDRILFVDPYYPQVFDFQWLAGNPQTALAGPSSVVLTQSLADKYFGEAMTHNQSVLGRRMKLNDKDELLVTGILADPPANVNLPFGMLVSYDFFKRNNPYFANNWSGNYQGTTFVVLPEGQSRERFEKQLAATKGKYLPPEYNKRVTYLLQPLREVHTNPFYGSTPGGYVVPGKMLLAVVLVGVFIVLIAAVNFINLATAQAVRRSKEVGIRKVLGSNRVQLFGQFMGETALLSTTALLVALTLTQAALAQINRALPVVGLDLQMDASVVGFAVAVAGITTLLAGLYPALVLSGYPPVQALKNKITPSQSGFSLRRVLIAGQFCIAQLLIIGTIVVATQMQYFRQKDLGFRKEAVVTVPVPDQDAGKRRILREKLSQIPGIQTISFSSGMPMRMAGQQYGTTFRLPHEPESLKRETDMKGVDAYYRSLFDLKLVAGNWFRQENEQQEGFNGFVVNEKLVEQLGMAPREIIGKQLIINEGQAPVIGVVRDFHNNSLQDEITPCVMMHWSSFFEYASLQLLPTVNTASHLPNTLTAVEAAWREVFPDGFYRYDFLDDQLLTLYTIENLIFRGIMVFAGIAIFISAMGLYGLVTFMAVQRTKEVGIRKVLGATVTSIVVLFGKEFLALVGLAFLVAAPLAGFLMQRWLEGFTYRVQLHPGMFAVALLCAVTIAWLTIGYQSVRSALANPVDSLRNE